MGYSWNAQLFDEYVAESLATVTRFLSKGDSKAGAQDQSGVFPGTADVVNRLVTPITRVTPGAYMVRPWVRSFWMRGDPGDAPFHGVGFYTDGWRFIGQTGATSNYTNHALAPTTAYGSAAVIGESNSSDILAVGEPMIPIVAWPSNGSHGAAGVKGHSAEVIYAGGWVQVASESQWQQPAAAYGDCYQYVPGYGTGTLRGFDRYELLVQRRNIPTGASGTEYTAGQVPYKVQTYNGSGANVAETSPGSGIYTVQTDAGFVPSNWTDAGVAIPISSNYDLQKLEIAPGSPTHGLRVTITGGNHANMQHARGLAVFGVTAQYEGTSHGAMIARYTMSGMQSGSLNHASFDGSASDPQRTYLEAINPTDIGITFGTNDWGSGVTAAAYAANNVAYLQRIRQYLPDVRVHFFLPYPGATLTSATLLGYAQAMYDAIPSLGDRRACLIDQYSINAGLPASYFNTVHLHNDQSGVQTFVDHLAHETGVGRRRYRSHRRSDSARRGMIVVPRRVS